MLILTLYKAALDISNSSCFGSEDLYPDPFKWNTEVLLPIQALFEEYAEDIDLYHMAFPTDWQEQLRK